MLITSASMVSISCGSMFSRRVTSNSQLLFGCDADAYKLIKKGEC